jgi:hypothetical protein
MRTNDSDSSWRAVAVAQAGMIEIARRVAMQSECRTCGRPPCLTPGFCRLCRQADRKVAKAKPDPKIERLRELMDEGVSLDRACAVLNGNHGAAASTIEALLLGLHERGAAALKQPRVRARLAQLSNDQVVDVAERLQRIKPEVAQAWDDDHINELFEARKRCTQETS